MKTRFLTFLMLLFIGSAFAQGAFPHPDFYFPEPVQSDDGSNGTCVALIYIDGVQVEEEATFEIAFFDEQGNCRQRDFVHHWVAPNGNDYGYQFQSVMYGNSSGQILTFKFYNHTLQKSSDELGYVCMTSFRYYPNVEFGALRNPEHVYFVTPTTCTFTNVDGNNWSTTANWSPRIPANCDDAVINGACIAAEEDLVYKSLTIKDGAQFFAPSNATIPAIVEKSITAYTPNTIDNYYFISSPIATPLDYKTFESAGMLQGEYDLYSFVQDPEDDLEWLNFKEIDDLEADFAGYLYANAQNITLSFNGNLFLDNGEDIYSKLTYDDDYQFSGFNLVGNPYPSNAKVTSSTSGKIDGFYTLNEERNEVVACTSDEPVVAPCTALFAVVNATKAKLSFTPIQGEDADAKNVQNSMHIEVVNNEMLKDRACVKFSEGNNLQKLTLNPNAPHVFFREEGKDFANIYVNDVNQLPLYFTTREYGQYTINVKLENMSCEYLHLIDNLTGMDIDLNATPSYTFTANSSDYACRFKLVFEGTGLEENAATENFAIVEGKRVIIPIIEHESQLEIIDLTGRVISSQKVNGSFDQTLNVKAGIYLLRMNGKIQKIVVK